MAPNHDPAPPADPNKVQEEDLQELEDVNQSLDEISGVLDVFEQRTDNILTQLRELLDSNREIRRLIEQENKQEKLKMNAGRAEGDNQEENNKDSANHSNDDVHSVENKDKEKMDIGE